MATVLLIGTLDTKGPETCYLRDRIRDLGVNTVVMDSGILGEAVGCEADISRQEVALAAGTTIEALRNAGTRGKAVEEMLKGVRKLTLELSEAGKIHGVVSLGGAEGAVLAASAMKVLPIGFPKLIVSPIASGHRKFGPLIGTRDTMVMHSIVDILGLNAISRTIYDNAAAAIAGMAKAYEKNKVEVGTDKPRKAIAATMLGNTTRPLMHIRPRFEDAGYDFVIFHANGVGGPAMEELIALNQFAGVLDYTLSEVAGQAAGGFHDGGTARLDAAAKAGIPQVIVTGCLDFVVFGHRDEVPDKYHGRPTYYHNPEFTLVRLTRDEQLAAARFLVEKLNRATGPVSVIVPLGGGSVMDKEGGAFWEPETNRLIRETIKNGLNSNIRYQEIEGHINDDVFADAVFEEMIRVLGARV
jgi:uncharacterized protein (UPF0261 family)